MAQTATGRGEEPRLMSSISINHHRKGSMFRLRFAYDLDTEDYDVAGEVLGNIEESLSHWDYPGVKETTVTLDLFSSDIDDLEEKGGSIHIKLASRWQREAMNIHGSDNAAILWMDDEPIAWTDDYMTVHWLSDHARKNIDAWRIEQLIQLAYDAYAKIV